MGPARSAVEGSGHYQPSWLEQPPPATPLPHSLPEGLVLRAIPATIFMVADTLGELIISQGLDNPLSHLHPQGWFRCWPHFTD